MERKSRGNQCCVNNVIAGRTCVNKWKHVTWVTTGTRVRCEIVYTRSTADKGSLAGFSLQSRFLDLDMVGHGDWSLGARWSKGSQWLLAGKQKRQRCKPRKITQRGMVKRRSYGSIWQSVFVSLQLPVSPTHPPATIPFEK